MKMADWLLYLGGALVTRRWAGWRNTTLRFRRTLHEALEARNVFSAVFVASDEGNGAWITVDESPLRDPPVMIIQEAPTPRMIAAAESPAVQAVADCSLEVINTLNSGFGSLRAAIDCANGNGLDDVINVPAGQYNLDGTANDDANDGGDLDLTEALHSITIRGAGADQTIIDARGIDRAVHVMANVTAVLEGLTVTGGSAINGGGISNSGALTLNDAIVRNNSATSGGGIRSTGELTLNRSSIKDNTAQSASATVIYGGGIYASFGGFVSLVDSTLEGNKASLSGAISSADVRGGGIASIAVPLTVVRSVIRENSVSNAATAPLPGLAFGGGIYISNSEVRLSGTEVRSNSVNMTTGGAASALSYGGGIYTSSSTALIENQSTVAENRVTNSSTTTGNINALAGGVYFAATTDSNRLTIRDSELSSNVVEVTGTPTSAAVSGGGAYFIGGIADLSRTVIRSNRATGSQSARGGGVSAVSPAGGHTNISFAEVVVSNNLVEASTLSHGGGIYAGANVTADVSRSTIEGNRLTGPGTGGGIYFSGVLLTLDSDCVSGNRVDSPQAGTAGGVYVSGAMDMVNSTVSGNVVNGAAGFTSSSGGVGTSSNPISIRSSTITGNRVFNGTTGGLYAYQSGSTRSVTMDNTIVAGNFSGAAGSTASDIVGSINVGTVAAPASFHNLIGDASTHGGLTHGVDGNIIGNDGSGTIDVTLVLNTVLAFNGGPTKTHALLPASPAIGAGSSVFHNTPDQRGYNRGLPVDIGAFQTIIANLPPQFTLASLPQATDEDPRLCVPGFVANIAAGPDYEPQQQISFLTSADSPRMLIGEASISSTGALCFQPARNVAGTVVISVRAQDDGGTAYGGQDTSLPQTFDIRIRKARVWHNAAKGLDVTADGHIVAGDALEVINFLNAFGPQKVPDDGRASGPFYDTNGDGIVVAGDALDVINHINAFGPEGESVSASMDVLASEPLPTAALTLDELVSLLANESVLNPKRRLPLPS